MILYYIIHLFQVDSNCDQSFVMVEGTRICGTFFTDQDLAANAAAVIGN